MMDICNFGNACWSDTCIMRNLGDTKMKKREMTRSYHKDCGGKIVEEVLLEHATIQLTCLKCGRVWGVLSDLSDIQTPKFRRLKLTRFSIFYQFLKNSRNPIINYLYSYRLIRVLKMVDFPSIGKCIGLDIGCATGYITQFLAQRLNGIVIGIDVSRFDMFRAKMRARYIEPSSCAKIEFILCDITHLPFKNNSLDLVMCASVLEHVEDLKEAVKEIKDSIRKDGILIAGYPIETSFFKKLISLFIHDPFYWRIRDSRILGNEQFRKSPETHKQDYVTIRNMLQKHFLMLCKEKSFLTILPDQISWYECVKMAKVK